MSFVFEERKVMHNDDLVQDLFYSHNTPLTTSVRVPWHDCNRLMIKSLLAELHIILLLNPLIIH